MLTHDGKELLDQTPVAIPVGFKKPESLQDQIRRLIRMEQYQALVNSGEAESLEESDDFDIDEDMPDFSSPWELQADEMYREALQAAQETSEGGDKEQPPIVDSEPSQGPS